MGRFLSEFVLKTIWDYRHGKDRYLRACLYAIILFRGEAHGGGNHAMEVEQLKMQLRTLLHQRDMLTYERDSLELFDLITEIEEEIQELHRKLRKIA
jgi:hypothetical protein